MLLQNLHVKKLLRMPNKTMAKTKKWFQQYFLENALHLAAKHNDNPALCKLLIDAGIDINSKARRLNYFHLME